MIAIIDVITVISVKSTGKIYFAVSSLRCFIGPKTVTKDVVHYPLDFVYGLFSCVVACCMKCCVCYQLFLLEEQRDRKYNFYARVIQRAFKKYFARRQRERQKAEAACKLLSSFFVCLVNIITYKSLLILNRFIIVC